jgi:hypothetical protein
MFTALFQVPLLLDPSFRGDAKHRARNLEIPGLVLSHHPGMTKAYFGRYSLL